MVWRALDAAKTLEREDSIEAKVVDVSIIKPSIELVLESLAKNGVAVTAEERRITGGWATRSAGRRRAASGAGFSLGMKDEFGVSGTAEACMEHFGLTANGNRRRRARGNGQEAAGLAPAHRAPLAPARTRSRSPSQIAALYGCVGPWRVFDCIAMEHRARRGRGPGS